MKLAAKKNQNWSTGPIIDMHSNKILSAIMTCVLAITLMAGFPAVKAYAASGTVYSCTINRCYAHPVTGVIEDSGGESSYATGQGMVEGCVYSNGILEVTDDGAYYLTIRMSLMDYTSGHSFQVQNVGDSGWSTPSEIGITGNGSDSNGTTADVCMRVPSENCVVRGSMYVEPMGRDVIFYLYPSNFSEGNNTDMNATLVTGNSASGDTDAQVNDDGNSSDAETSSGGGSLSSGSGDSSLKSSSKDSDSKDSDKTEEKDADTDDKESKELESSITVTATPEAQETPSTDSSTLDSASGLSLSTAEDAEDTGADADSTENSGNRIFQIALAIVISGLILIGVAAAVVYFFRKNWNRWGGAQDDDE